MSASVVLHVFLLTFLFFSLEYYSMRVDKYLSEKKKLIEKKLDTLLPPESEYPEIIHRAMRYSVFAGGKRIRPILTIAGFEACGGKRLNHVLPCACTIELIHTFSFIHDDLPCIDNDDYRRGKLTSHKVFGEAIAVLTGDALLNLSFEIIANTNLKVRTKVDILKEITKAIGTDGVLGGEVIDIMSEGKKLDPEKLEYIHTKKTGALISASLKIGGLCAEASSKKLKALKDAGSKLGYAFQIVDDILDVEGDDSRVGKKTGKDAESGKITYPGLYGIEGSKSKVKELCSGAKGIFDKFGVKGEILKDITDFIGERTW